MERYLRRATTQDIKLLFKWANDSETRKNSFNTNPISWEEHQAWFARKIADDKSEIYIFMDFFVPVGMVRLDFEDEHTAVISYSIAAEYRGMGRATEMLTLMEKNFASAHKGCVLKAEVKEENTISAGIFTSLGYDKKADGLYVKNADAQVAKRNPKPRDISLEVLRIVAMMMVIVLHYLSKGGLLSDVSQDRSGDSLLLWLLESFALSCVNVYVFISGYYLVSKKFTISRIVRVWGQVFFYSFGIAVVSVATGLVSFDSISDLYQILFMVFPICMGHYWFATAYVFMLIFSPILSEAAKRLGQRGLGIAIILLLTVFSFVKTFIPFELPYEDQGNGIIWFTVLFLIAAYIRLYGENILKGKLKPFILYVVSSLAIWIYLITAGLITERTGKYEYLMSQVTHYNFVFVLTASIGLFILFKNMNIKENAFTRFLMRIAPYTFGVYLLHEHILVAHKWIDWFGVEKEYGIYRIVHIIATVMIIFTAGIIIDFLRTLLFKAISKASILCLKIYYSGKEAWDYLIFGFLATVVNWVVYLVVSRIYMPEFTGIDADVLVLISNTVAWIASVLFAYWTNRVFVFRSEVTDVLGVLREIGLFVSARILSFLVEQVLMFVMLKCMSANDLIAKLVIGIVVILLNYIFSKLIIFKGKDKKK